MNGEVSSTVDTTPHLNDVHLRGQRKFTPIFADGVFVFLVFSFFLFSPVFCAFFLLSPQVGMACLESVSQRHKVDAEE